jgi:ArsR family transcriptional regulator
MSTPSFSDEQRAYWRDADAAHFAWQTAGFIGAAEAALLEAVDVAPGERLLEIGCGEGGNLHHLAARGARRFGVDFSHARARFAARALDGAHIVRADAERLPFCDAAFDAVLVRDLLHHACDRVRVLAEAHRVLRPGGRLTVIEPNARNPLIAAQAAAIVTERGMLTSTRDRLYGELVRAGMADVTVERAQPMPLSRVLFHHRFGAPRLGDVATIAAAMRTLEAACARLPRTLWAYLVAHGRKPAP